MRYLCSLGSNIEPQRHLPQAILALLELSPCLSLSRVILTEPVGMASQRDFLNALVCLDCPLEPAALKQRFNHIERRLGRDRDDPLRSGRDREMDLDILAHGVWRIDRVLAGERYLQALANDFDPNAELLSAPSRLIRLANDVSVGQRPATIDREPTTGDIRVVEQIIDGFADRFQSALNA